MAAKNTKQAVPEITLAGEMSAPVVLPAPEVIERRISKVLVEIPLCDNPPGIDDHMPSFMKAHINLQLIKARTATGRRTLHRLWWALKETGAKLANGRKVVNRNDAVVWLIERVTKAV